jgi:hypothetical protein
MYFRKEAALFSPVANYVHRKSYRWQQPEVQFYEYRIDLYGFSQAKDLTIAIELKLHKWRRAFAQALIYQLCADLVFIALPSSTICCVEHELLSEHGIGLIAVEGDGSCRQVIASKRSDVIRRHYRNGYIKLLKERIQCPQ